MIRDEMANLGSLLSAAQASFARLQSRLAALEAKNASKEKTDSKPDSDSVSTRLIELPNEMYLEIAQYLAPGSRTLANFSSTNKDLRSLLLPLLVRHLDAPMISNESFAVFLALYGIVFRQHVSKIDFIPKIAYGPDFNPVAGVSLSLLKICENIASLGLDFMNSDWDLVVLNNACFPKLHVAELRGALPARLPRCLPRLFPNVETLDLHYTQNHDDCIFDFDSGSVFEAGCTKLQDLRLTIWVDHERLLELPALLSKITEYALTNRCESFMTLCSDTIHFKPKRIFTDPDKFIPGWRRLWNAIVSLGSLRSLHLEWLDSCYVVHGGFPPNLRCFVVDEFLPTTRSADELNRLRASVPASLTEAKVNIVIYELDEIGTQEWQSLLDELVFWDSVHCDEHRMEVNFDMAGGEHRQVLLAEEVQKRSRRSKPL